MSKGLELLETHYPSRAAELRAVAGTPVIEGPLEQSAAKVWQFSQLYLLWNDEDDYEDGYVIDKALAREVHRFANRHPRCSIEEEAQDDMRLMIPSMTEFELRLALWCTVDTMGYAQVLQGTFDHNIRMYLEYRDRVNPSMRGR